ncbi:AAA family ATPase [Deinococcus cellulosilyticus]|uniref:ATPase n=1 Tax=Deinococcus cellulosilyticus (strain DSM 18568 / NBRC 106333 / KACC 11606 / 5516J-15) TaxID=1223518 RepID=A0A511MXU8_DEIC1|nr:AAA family ATPase [Deinococcus cellulosilyticus]GEM44977.1 ATPase [Deinococcus cellulosilyticus NBRC 106333 = KACC 11606]
MLSRESTPYPLKDQPILIVVGVTGVGKSTTLDELQALGVPFTLLPNRREVTDDFIFDGEVITDRSERFKRTAKFRETHPGGMGQLLTELYLQEAPKNTLIFDGLRGLDEVQHAAQNSQSRFIVLDAPDLVRASRLLGRGDTFDQVQVETSGSTLESLKSLKGIDQVFSEEDIVALSQLDAPAENILAKVKIVVDERKNYDPKEANAYLTGLGDSKRVLYVDTTRSNPAEVARLVKDWL